MSQLATRRTWAMAHWQHCLIDRFDIPFARAVHVLSRKIVQQAGACKQEALQAFQAALGCQWEGPG